MMTIDTYTLVLSYRGGEIIRKTDLELIDLYDPGVRYPGTGERPVSIHLSPAPPEPVLSTVVATLKCKLMPGVPKGQVTYGN